MGDVKGALAASIVARGIAALTGLVALPLYVRFLGLEAYGIVGVFASMQVLVAFMDLGLPTTLTRELARLRQHGELGQARSLLLTFELASVCLALLSALLLAAAAPLVASHWVNLETLFAGHVTTALQLGAIALACQWPANLYAAGLAGIHRQTELALSSAVFAVLRVAVSLVALWHKPTLESFFLAQILTAILQSAAMRAQLWRNMRLPGHRAVVAVSLLHRSREFAGGMTAITITSILLMQMDKVILSYLLRLPDFGLYVVASTLATALYILISPVFSVIYPRLAALWSTGDTQSLAQLYHASSQAMAVLVIPLALVMASFPKEALFVLTGDESLSAQAQFVLSLLVVGWALNGIMNMPYALQLASGWISLTIRTNTLAIAALLPVTWWLASQWGVEGGAVSWLALNLGYLVVTPHLVHQRLLPQEKRRWYLEDTLRPGGAALVAVGALWLLHDGDRPRLTTAAQLAFYWAVATGAAALSLSAVLARASRESPAKS